MLKSQSYTAELAYDAERRRNRTSARFGLFRLLPRSHAFDRYVLGPWSLVNGLGIAATTTAGFFCLVPSMIFSKYVMRWPSAIHLPAPSTSDGSRTNTSNTEVGSLTAIKTLSARSQMYIQRSGGPDNIAPLLMSQLCLFGPNIPGSRYVTRVYNLLCRLNFYLTGRVFADQLAEIFFSKTIKFGEVGILQTRTCWFDDVVESFANRHVGRSFNIVILGAGYDTRCYRLLSQNVYVKWYEVDAAGSQRSKKDTLNNARVDTSNVRFVPCDFETQDWMDSLQSDSDFDKSAPSLFIWEGVCYYLDREVVVSTITKISACGSGSCIAFDYFDKSCLNDTIRKSSKSIGEPLKFGIDDVEKLVEDCNTQFFPDKSFGVTTEALVIMDHLRCKELKKRYVAQINGRCIGYLSEFGGALLLGSL